MPSPRKRIVNNKAKIDKSTPLLNLPEKPGFDDPIIANKIKPVSKFEDPFIEDKPGKD